MSFTDETDMDTAMKKEILQMFDTGRIKLGQRVPMAKGVGAIPATKKEIEIIMHFEELTITEDLIKRLRTEMR